MNSVKRIQPGQYQTSDNRFIIKDGSNWYVLDLNGEVDFGPLPTLAACKEYVATGRTTLGNHNHGSKHGQKQNKKEFNAYLAAEAKNGNYAPAILWIILLIVVAVLVEVARTS